MDAMSKTPRAVQTERYDDICATLRPPRWKPDRQTTAVKLIDDGAMERASSASAIECSPDVVESPPLDSATPSHSDSVTLRASVSETPVSKSVNNQLLIISQLARRYEISGTYQIYSKV